MINPLTHRKILKKGLPGRAAIVALGPPSREATSFNVAMTLQVHVQGVTPFEVEDQWMVKAKDYVGLSGSIPVKIDPEEHEKVAIDWDVLRGELEDQTAARRQALAAQGPVGSGWQAQGADPFLGAAQAQGAPQVVDMANDPELRRKVEEVLGHELVPGSTESIGQDDPMLQMRIMQVVQEHMAQKATQATATSGGGTTQEGDSLARLERLTALKNAGALTEAEFEAEKKKIIGGP